MNRSKIWGIIIAILFFISLIASVVVLIFHRNGNVVSVYHCGHLIERINLDTVTTPYEFTVESDNGAYNTISVEHGRICVIDASCPDHVCINTGWLSDGAIPIVCLPNELVIQTESAQTVDAAVQ